MQVVSNSRKLAARWRHQGDDETGHNERATHAVASEVLTLRGEIPTPLYSVAITPVTELEHGQDEPERSRGYCEEDPFSSSGARILYCRNDSIEDGRCTCRYGSSPDESRFNVALEACAKVP